MTETRKTSRSPASVNAIRSYQRDWLEGARSSALAGEPFAICHGDEFEEIFHTLGIPVLVANYWNFLIIAQRQAGHYSEVLEKRGYPGPHFLGLGLAASLEPEQAPWGGLPKPLVVLGSTRDEAYLRTTELWARELDCPCYPLDFGFSSKYVKPLPDNWWLHLRNDWESLVDERRLELRIKQNQALLSHLERVTGRTAPDGALLETMALLTQQMDRWQEACELIATSRPCPVSLRDQLAAYQAMWHRGTTDGLELIENYLAEVRQLADDAHQAYMHENIRLLFWSTRELPAFHQHLEEEYGAVFVGSAYSGIPALYARTVYDNDPMRALAARQLLLFTLSPDWMLYEAERHQADAIVLIEPESTFPSECQMAAESAGLPCISLPDTRDNEHNREKLRGTLAGCKIAAETVSPT